MFYDILDLLIQSYLINIPLLKYWKFQPREKKIKIKAFNIEDKETLLNLRGKANDVRERVLTFQRNHLSYAESRVTATNNKRANPKQNPTIAINAWRWFNFKNNIDEMKQKTKWMNTSFVSSNLPLRLKVVFDHEPRQSSVDKWRQSKSPA